MKYLCIFCTFLFVTQLQAQEFSRYNINPDGDATLSHFAELNGSLFMTGYCAGNTCHGLWKTEGNPNDLVQIADLATHSPNSSIFRIVSNGELLFFSAQAVDDTEYGEELWVSDGTPQGTVMLKDIDEGPAPSEPEDFFIYGNILLFSAEEGEYGRELYRSDGTPEGTYLLKNINEGEYDSDPRDFIEMNGIVYFIAETIQEGFELWRTDGTEDGTYLVKDLYFGSNGSSIQQMTVYNDMLIFRGSTPWNGSELCRSDGTPEGTFRVKDFFTPSNESGNPGNFIVYNDLVYFSARENLTIGTTLWSTDGTEEGTEYITDISATGTPNFSNFVLFNDLIYFEAGSGEYGRELWKTDGTHDGTSLVIDIQPGPGSSVPDRLLVSNGKLYFFAYETYDNRQFYVSDGTQEGTVKAMPENSTAIDPIVSDYDRIYPYDNGVFFTARYDEIGSTVWRYGDIGTFDSSIDLSSSSEIQLYPNPGRGAIKILCESCNEAYNVRVMSPEGKVLDSFISNGEIRLDGYPNGIYLIAIKTNDGSEIVRKYMLMD